MKIGINALAQVGGGSRTYLKNILPQFAKLGEKNRYLVFVPADNKVEKPSFSNIYFVKLPVKSNNICKRFVFDQLVIPFLVWKKGLDLLFCPTDIAALLSPIPVVLAIRNPNPYHILSKWSFLKRLKLKLMRLLSKVSCWKAKRVFFVSDYSRKRVEEEFNLNKVKTRTIYHGINVDDFKKEPSVSTKNRKLIEQYSPYFLTVSTLNPHKNIELAIEAFADLPSETKKEYSFLIVGNAPDQQYFKKLENLAQQKGIKKDIVFTGEGAYSEIPAFYQKAFLFFLPSILETFGHTLVEAMAAGCPIVAADAASIPEVCDGAALFFDPQNPKEAAEKISKVIENSNLKKGLIKKGKERVQDFSWKKTARETLNLFKEVK